MQEEGAILLTILLLISYSVWSCTFAVLTVVARHTGARVAIAVVKTRSAILARHISTVIWYQETSVNYRLRLL